MWSTFEFMHVLFLSSTRCWRRYLKFPFFHLFSLWFPFLSISLPLLILVWSWGKKDSSHSLNLIKINFISLIPIQFPVRRILIHYRHFISMMHHKFYFTYSQNEFPDLLLNLKIKLKKETANDGYRSTGEGRKSWSNWWFWFDKKFGTRSTFNVHAF